MPTEVYRNLQAEVLFGLCCTNHLSVDHQSVVNLVRPMTDASTFIALIVDLCLQTRGS